MTNSWIQPLQVLLLSEVLDARLHSYLLLSSFRHFSFSLHFTSLLFSILLQGAWKTGTARPAPSSRWPRVGLEWLRSTWRPPPRLKSRLPKAPSLEKADNCRALRWRGREVISRSFFLNIFLSLSLWIYWLLRYAFKEWIEFHLPFGSLVIPIDLCSHGRLRLFFFPLTSFSHFCSSFSLLLPSAPIWTINRSLNTLRKSAALRLAWRWFLHHHTTTFTPLKVWVWVVVRESDEFKGG